MSLSCDELRSLMLEHHAGELAVEHREQFEAHLILCEHCTFYVESYTHTVAITHKLPRCGLPADVESRLRAALKDHLG